MLDDDSSISSPSISTTSLDLAAADTFFDIDPAPQKTPVEAPVASPSKRDRLVYELYTTEISYVNSLAILVHEYIKPLRNYNIISREELSSVFGNLELIYDLHVSLLDSFEAAITSYSASDTTVAPLLEAVLPLFAQYYPPFCSVFSGARDVIALLRAHNSPFASFFLQRCQLHGGRDIFFYLIMPIQRLPRYELLLNELAGKTKKSHPDAASLSSVAAAMGTTNARVNDLLAQAADKGSRRGKKESSGSGSAGLDMYMSEPTRRIIWEAPISLRTPGRVLWGVLFNDSFVVGEKVTPNAAKAGALFLAELETKLDTTWVEDLEDLDPSTINNDAFEVYTPSRSYFLYAGSSDSKSSWIRALQTTIDEFMAIDRVDALIVSDSADSKGLLGSGPDPLSGEDTEDASTATGGGSASASEANSDATGADQAGIRRAMYYYEDGAIYDGTLKEGSRHGRGHIFFPSKDHYVGNFVEGARDGHGVYRWASGAVYDGNWVANQPSGHGVYKDRHILYDGVWKNGAKHGKGRFVYGTITYEGEFRDGLRHGTGKLVSSTTPLEYDGEWARNMRSGQGRAVLEDGSVYEGTWAFDVPHGSGKLVSRQGREVYEGDFEEGLKSGQGVLTIMGNDDHSMSYSGSWSHGVYHGQGELLDFDGSVYTGTFKNGLKSGSGSLITPWGYTYEGGWELDKLSGSGTLVLPDGSEYRGEFFNGQRHGKGLLETPWGYSYRGHWAYDRKEGRGKECLPSGHKYDGYWKAGKREGFGVAAAPSNKAKYSGNWANNVRSGEGTQTYLWGTYSGNWENDVRSGQGKSTLAGGVTYEGSFYRDRREGRGVLTTPTPANDAAAAFLAEEGSSDPSSEATSPHPDEPSAITTTVMCSGGRIVTPDSLVCLEQDMPPLS